MNYWLMKSEPDAYSIDDLRNQPGKCDHWDGVRNYQARNFMRDDMRIGDRAFFYHSACKEPAIVGMMEIISDPYPDFTALDPESNYFDPKSSEQNNRWVMVDVKFIKKFRNPLSLRAMKQIPKLEGMRLLQRGNRLSIMPVTQKEWQIVVSKLNV